MTLGLMKLKDFHFLTSKVCARQVSYCVWVIAPTLNSKPLPRPHPISRKLLSSPEKTRLSPSFPYTVFRIHSYRVASPKQLDSK